MSDVFLKCNSKTVYHALLIEDPNCFTPWFHVPQIAEDVTAAHNLLRAALGRQPIVWDESLAQLAHDQVGLC
jgi:hypothetical protein